MLTGLDRLESLYIDSIIGEADANITFCPLVSLKLLYLQDLRVNLSNTCLQTIPLKSVEVSLYNENSFILQMLKNLSNLVFKADDTNVAISSLNLLHAPLQNLTLRLKNANLSTTSFESWPKWKASLLKLTISGTHDYGYMWIFGSPFKWFTKLKVLSIICLNSMEYTIHTLSPDIFDGLESLTELHVTYTNIPGSLYRALSTFSKYSSLLILNLSRNHMYDYDYDVFDGIYLISSLRSLDLSNNEIGSFYMVRTLPNLKILHMEDQNLPQARPASISLLCKYIVPRLHILDAHNVGFVTLFGLNEIICPELISLNLAKNKIIDVVGIRIVAPRLEDLNLTGITVQSGNLTAIKLLTVFNTTRLRIVDLSASKVSHIDKEEATLLVNLTYLDLRNNQITSLNGLQHMRNVKVLFLGGNIFHIVPNLIVSTHPSLNSFDLQDNVFECDCNIEQFRKWILTDKKVYLWNNMSNGKRYRCDGPDSRKGFSITEIDLDCRSYLLTYISVGVTVTMLIVITLAVLVVRYHWHIQYRVFLLFNRRAYQNYLVNDDEVDADDEDEHGVPRYDAYVTYHRQDEDWIDEELVANIEEGEEPFRLCLRTRDIRAGRLIFNELSLRIQRSRKILVILSPRFVDDNWCYFELNIAHHRVLEENRFVLIFIILENIPNNKLTLLLRQLFCRVQVIKWPADGRGQDLFWQHRREELKRPVPLDRRFNI